MNAVKETRQGTAPFAGVEIARVRFGTWYSVNDDDGREVHLLALHDDGRIYRAYYADNQHPAWLGKVPGIVRRWRVEYYIGKE